MPLRLVTNIIRLLSRVKLRRDGIIYQTWVVLEIHCIFLLLLLKRTSSTVLFLGKFTPKVFSGTYNHSAGQLAVRVYLESMPAQAQVMAQRGTPLTQLHLTIIGNKIAGDKICEGCTFFFALCLIFPFFFMCCDWWKKIVHPKYEVSIETYQAIAKALDSVPTIDRLLLRVADNAFNTEKADILYYVMASRKLTNFIFLNRALEFDWRENEYSNFRANMQPILSLGVPCQIRWRNQRVI